MLNIMRKTVSMKRKRNYNEDNDEEDRPTKKRKIDRNSELLHEYTCPITRQIFCNPVSAEDGRIYEEQYIKKWFDVKESSPFTGEIIDTTLHPLIPMKNLINDLIAKHPECKEYQYIPDDSYHANKDTIMIYIVDKNFHKLLNYTDYLVMDIISDDIITSDDTAIQTAINKNLTIFEHIIRNCKNDNIIKYVIDNCIDLEVAGGVREYKPIHLVCQYGSPDVIKYMVNKRVDLKCTAKYNLRPIYFICKHQSAEMVKFFCDRGVDFEFRDFFGRTPLHIACKYNNYEAVRYMIKKGANIMIPSNNNLSPSGMCLRFQDKKTILYMLSMYYKKILELEKDKTMDKDKNILLNKNFKFNLISLNKKLNNSEKYEIYSTLITLKNKHRDKKLTEKDLPNYYH